MSIDTDTNTEEQQPIDLYNLIVFAQPKIIPWERVFYVDCPQFLSFNLFEKYGVRPFFFHYFEKDDMKYIGVSCCVRKKRFEDFLKCIYELQRNMMICGYNDYEQFCRELRDSIEEARDIQ